MSEQQFEKITERGVRRMISHRLETGSQSWVPPLTMRVGSDQGIEDYGWLGNAPAMRKFVAGRQIEELNEYSFQIKNEDYENGIRIKSKDMRRDKLGVIQSRVNQLADRALDHPAGLLSTLIQNGESTTCYDGQFFFDTDHPFDGGAQSNDITFNVVTPADPTSDEMAPAIVRAIQTIMGLKDDRGEPMNQSATEFMVMVPTTMMGATLQAIRALLGSGGATAVLEALRPFFNIVPAVNPRLTWTDKFGVFRVDEDAKPFILQEEMPPEPYSLGEGSEFETLNKEQLYGVDWAGNVGFGHYQMGCLVTLN